MNFTIAYSDLQLLLKGAVVSRPRKGSTLVLSACAARVFIFSGDGVAGVESLVLEDGAVTVSAKDFIAVFATYKGTRHLSFQGSASGLRIQNFTMPILGYDPSPAPPAEFQVFRPADSSKVTGKSSVSTEADDTRER